MDTITAYTSEPYMRILCLYIATFVTKSTTEDILRGSQLTFLRIPDGFERSFFLIPISPKVWIHFLQVLIENNQLFSSQFKNTFNQMTEMPVV